MQKRWRILEGTNALPAEAFPEMHPVVTRLLANRGITDAFQAESFLNPDFETGIHDPFRFARMTDAVARVFTALEGKEKITVHGDYDADGVTGSTTVITVLRELERRIDPTRTESKIDYYIPHRDKEGYGLHLATVGILKERGTSLIITVDCGIACVAEIALAKEQGIETIVLDHHQFGETLPDGYLIHPRLPGESYPFEHLAAVGVAWKFSCALITEARTRGFEIPPGWEKWLLDLVSIATVTDMVPLVGENRVLLTYGLKVLNKTRRLGLKMLVDGARMKGDLDSESIGFSIGPRINAAGRMDHAELALRLLLSENNDDASRLAFELEQCNRDRQKAVAAMMEEAEEMLDRQRDASALVFWKSEWSPALVGLVAGRYLERTGKPVIAFGKHGSHWIGSGRSPSVYDITAAMKRIGEGILTRSGGHVQACGFSFVEDEHAGMLAERLQADAGGLLSAEDMIPELLIDAEVLLDDVDWRLVSTVERLAPYGMGNTKPLFVSRHLEIVDVGLVGSTGTHLRFTARSDGGRAQKFIGFKFGSRLEELKPGVHVDVVYDVGVNEWNGRRDIQCKIVDFKTA
ncbi:MAG: single-stranded-DNA-specific exonuclease RecJ [Patescibacteria group bacterium]|jgi:single-stranded-DNA-specific exonuclease